MVFKYILDCLEMKNRFMGRYNKVSLWGEIRSWVDLEGRHNLELSRWEIDDIQFSLYTGWLEDWQQQKVSDFFPTSLSLNTQLYLFLILSSASQM